MLGRVRLKRCMKFKLNEQEFTFNAKQILLKILTE